MINEWNLMLIDLNLVEFISISLNEYLAKTLIVKYVCVFHQVFFFQYFNTGEKVTRLH